MEVANNEQAGMPNLTSLPSAAWPASTVAVPPVAVCASKKLIPPTAAAQMITMTASSA